MTEQFVDGFVIPLPEGGIENYRKIAEKASKVWMDHGAVEYRECVLEDADAKEMVTFPELAKAGPGETVVFAWITYHSREDRDSVNAKVMADPRMTEMMENECPFDYKRMAYGGFRTLVKA